jgi:single-strand DNA-binding protein
MSLELNKVLVVGNLTHDVETRMTNTGKKAAKLRLAINRRGYGGGQDEVTYIDATVWDKQADFADNYLKKGSSVYVEGRLKMDSWDDKATGAKRTKIEIVADRVAFADSKPAGEGKPAARKDAPKTKEEAEQDDLPY